MDNIQNCLIVDEITSYDIWNKVLLIWDTLGIAICHSPYLWTKTAAIIFLGD